MRISSSSWILTGSILAALGCGDRTPAPETDVAEALRPAVGGSGAEPVTVATLEAMVPDRLLGMSRVDHSSQRAGTAGFVMTVVSARYEEGNRRLQLTITDAPAGGPALAAANAWTMATFERTTSSGYQKTTVVDGFRGYEEFDSRRERATVSAFIANRIVFNLRGDHIPMEDVRRAVGEFGLRRLGRLGGE